MKTLLDIVFDEPSTPEADTALAEAIAALGPRAALVDHIERSPTAGERIVRTIDSIGGESGRVASRRTANWLGFVWTKDYGYSIDGKRYPSLAASLAGIDDLRTAAPATWTGCNDSPKQRTEPAGLFHLAISTARRATAPLAARCRSTACAYFAHVVAGELQ